MKVIIYYLLNKWNRLDNDDKVGHKVVFCYAYYLGRQLSAKYYMTTNKIHHKRNEKLRKI